MSNITKKNKEGLVLLGETRLQEVQASDMKQLLIKEIIKLYFLTGNSKHSPEVVAMTATEVYNDLMQIWPGIKIEWIQKAFKQGIQKEHYGINYTTIMKFIMDFRDNMKKEDFIDPVEPRNINDQAADLVELARKNPERLIHISELLNKNKSKRK